VGENTEQNIMMLLYWQLHWGKYKSRGMKMEKGLL
jgi:hypothetical protein